MKPLAPAALAPYLDHALVAPDATRATLERHCQDAQQHHFHGVCVYSSRVELAASLLEETSVKVIALVGFPFGATDADAKRFETEVAVDQGAQEIEMVLNLGRLKDGEHRYVVRELRDIAEAAEERPVTVVIECRLLTTGEIAQACELILDSGVKAVATGSGLGAAAIPDVVRELRGLVGEKFGVKASGGIVSASGALALLEAGATRLGSFKSVEIVLEPIPP